MKTAILERGRVGGTCVNTGCIPTKTLVASAAVARAGQQASEFGVTIDGRVGVDMKKVKARKDRVSGDVRRGNEEWLQSLPNLTLIRGHARFESPR
jgi:pyruvate/2-oxoglutarate dehydrogenase complex dihydrolipoamide dehydrogenase (E3) component